MTTYTPIPQELIEKALALTGKNLSENNVSKRNFEGNIIEFSIEKFCYYLLSESFIEKYHELTADTINCHITMTAEYVGMCIWQYQSGNPYPLINLLSKI